MRISADAPETGTRARVAVSADMPQVVLSGSWDRTLVCWDLREGPASVQQVSLNEKVHDLDVRWPFALVGGASPGQALLFDVRKAKGALTSTVCKTSQHLAGHPPRCVALFPKGLYDKGDSSGFCVGAYEGRVGVHFGPTTAAAPATGSKEWGDDFTFKCHRTPAATGRRRRRTRRRPRLRRAESPGGAAGGPRRAK